MRKFTIGIVSLAIVIGAFALYSRLDTTPSIETNTGVDFNGVPDMSNIDDFNETMGTLLTNDGEIGLGRTENFEIVNRNNLNGEIEWKFGFEKLLHKEGDIWQIEKPYMELYRKNFTIYMQAEQGVARMEKVGEKNIPKEATFSNNVEIHIKSDGAEGFNDSTIYLDSLMFNSEKSQLSTYDKVVFFSENIQLYGTGMELIYNDESERLEYFKVIDVDQINVRMRRRTFGTISNKEESELENVPKIDNTNNNQEVREFASLQDSSPGTDESKKDYYTCILSKNVLIETPDQFIFAEDEININDILFSGGKKDTKEDEELAAESEPNNLMIAANDSNDLTIVTAEPNEQDTEQEYVNVVIKCDNGFLIAPQDSLEIGKFRGYANTLTSIDKPQIADSGKKVILSTKKIELTALNSDYVATGPTELVFFVEDANNSDPNLQSFPVTITSQLGAKYIKDVNQVVFEGDAICTIPQNDLSIQKNATLTSPQLAINIPESEDTLPDVNASGPVNLLFYVEDTNATIDTQRIIPVEITAKGKALYLPGMNKVIFNDDCLCQIGSEEISKEQFISLTTPNLQIDLPQEQSSQSFAFSDINAAGPVDLKFFMKDPNNMGTIQSLMPVNITAQKNARYISSSRQIVLEGSCKNSMIRENEEFLQELTLLSGRVRVDLPEDINDQEQASTLTEIRHLKADGDQVILKVTKKNKDPEIQIQTDDQILGWTQLLCKSLDYDTQEQIFKATGTGELTLSDIEIKESIEAGGMKILGKKWWAVVSDFNDLNYLLSNNRIIANAEPGKTIEIKYIEQQNEERSPVIMATAGHIEIELKENEDKKLEPSKIVASGGIDYQKDENSRFRGSVLSYDHETSIITILGDEKSPAYYNSIPMDQIFINMNTGSVSSEITGPGSI